MCLKSAPRLALGGLVLLGATVAAATAAPRSPAFPHYNPAQLCRTGLEGTMGQTLDGLCVRDEQDASANLRRRWSTLSAEALNRCVEQQASLQKTYGGSGSYQGLKTCVDQPVQTVDEVPPTEQRTKAPVQAGRRGGTTSSPADQITNPPTVGTGTTPGMGFGTPGLGTAGTPGLGTPGTGAGGTGALGTTGTGLGTTGLGTPGLGTTGLGTTGTGTTGTGLGTPGLGTSGTGTTGTGLGSSGLGTSGGAGSSLGGGSTGSGTAGGASGGGAGGGSGGR
jgi:hypothetical protein